MSAKLDFETMPWAELRADVLAHREDMEALYVFIDRCVPDPDARGAGYPYTEENMKHMKAVFQRKIAEAENQE